MKAFIVVVKLIAFAITMGVWCTLGLVMWIALIARVTAIATLEMTLSLIGNARYGSSYATARKVEDAASMWYRGCLSIVHGYFGSEGSGVRAEAESDEGPINWKRVFVEVVYSFFFYGSLLLLYVSLTSGEIILAGLWYGIRWLTSSWIFWIIVAVSSVGMAVWLVPRAIRYIENWRNDS